jgi:restriction system protein
MRGRRNIERRRREALQDKEFAYQLAMAEEARKKKEQQAFANLRLRQFIDVSPEEFEISMGSLFRKQGFEVIHSGRQGDGGVDLEMEKDGLRYIVQCKRFTKQAVGEPSLRDFYGTLVHRKADHGFFVTTSKFTPQAEEFVKHKPLTLIDKDELQKWLT